MELCFLVQLIISKKFQPVGTKYKLNGPVSVTSFEKPTDERYRRYLYCLRSQSQTSTHQLSKTNLDR